MWSKLKPHGAPVGDRVVFVSPNPFPERRVHYGELHGFAAVNVRGQHPAQLWILEGCPGRRPESFFVPFMSCARDICGCVIVIAPVV